MVSLWLIIIGSSIPFYFLLPWGQILQGEYHLLKIWLDPTGFGLGLNHVWFTSFMNLNRYHDLPILWPMMNILISRSLINVLGVIFDSKMQWADQVFKLDLGSKQISEWNKINQRVFFNKELQQLITTKFYSILFYNSEIWQTLKISECAQKLWTCGCYPLVNLHEMAGRAMLDKLTDYKLALQLYRVVNNQVQVQDWVNININNIQTRRQTTFMSKKSSRLRIGMNIISNRFYYLNGRICLYWLNQAYRGCLKRWHVYTASRPHGCTPEINFGLRRRHHVYGGGQNPQMNKKLLLLSIDC